MDRYLCWTGGKDSTASAILCHEKGIKVDGVIMVEVMFDNNRNISGENPEHIKWVYEVAIPKIEKDLGFPVIVLKSQIDYLQDFNAIIGKRSKVPERIGKKRGFFLGGYCGGNSRLKLRTLNKFFKGKNCEQIVGIAFDEKDRLEKKTMIGKRSVLAEFEYTEEMAFKICEKYGLLSPIYQRRKRNGCWFCPNQSIEELFDLKKHHPELWGELKTLSQDPLMVTKGFKYGKTFDEIEKEVEKYEVQNGISRNGG